MRKVNPRLVYVGLIGYGDNGPYAGKPAYDDLIQGISALPATAAQAGAREPVCPARAFTIASSASTPRTRCWPP